MPSVNHAPISHSMSLKLMKEIAEETNTPLKLFYGDHVRIFGEGEDKQVVFGVKFPINSTGMMLLVENKAATSEVLNTFGIPSVPHIQFGKGRGFNDFSYTEEDIEGLKKLLAENDEIVLKSNSGTCGADLFKVKHGDEARLMEIANFFFERGTQIAAGPRMNISDEYRCIMLNGEAQVVYRKAQAEVTGDGQTPIIELANGQKLHDEIDEYYVPAAGEKVKLHWQHNLAMGAMPDTNISEEKKQKLAEFATKVVKVVGANFCSVDVVEVDGEFMVMEVNGGVMMEKFAAVSEENYIIAKEIYRKALGL